MVGKRAWSDHFRDGDRVVEYTLAYGGHYHKRLRYNEKYHGGLRMGTQQIEYLYTRLFLLLTFGAR